MKRVHDTLKANGYYKGMNVNSDTYIYDENDKDAFGKFLVGQYISTGHPSIAEI